MPTSIHSVYRNIPNPDLGDTQPIRVRFDYEITANRATIEEMFLDKVYVCDHRDNPQREVDPKNAEFWLSLCGYSISGVECEARAYHHDHVTGREHDDD